MNKKIKIGIAKNGPLVTNNLDKIVKSTGSYSSLSNKSIALCRCGKSKNKPFCDGTHGKIDFEDSQKPDRVKRQLDNYIGKEITIHDDRGICSHAGFCTDGLPNVFLMREDPWINPDSETVEKIIETIKKTKYLQNAEIMTKLSQE